MNNIFLNNDPLLYSSKTSQDYPPQIPMEYYRMREQIPVKDYLGDLDKELKSLDQQILESLNENSKFVQLNQSLQATVQDEMLSLVRNKLNVNPGVVDNIKQQLDIINETRNRTKEVERQNMYELNDYMQNYSHLTFDEYRKLKNGENEITVENKSSKKR